MPPNLMKIACIVLHVSSCEISLALGLLLRQMPCSSSQRTTGVVHQTQPRSMKHTPNTHQYLGVQATFQRRCREGGQGALHANVGPRLALARHYADTHVSLLRHWRVKHQCGDFIPNASKSSSRTISRGCTRGISVQGQGLKGLAASMGVQSPVVEALRTGSLGGIAHDVIKLHHHSTFCFNFGLCCFG